jgi:hypothetical protein
MPLVSVHGDGPPDVDGKLTNRTTNSVARSPEFLTNAVCQLKFVEESRTHHWIPMILANMIISSDRDGSATLV